MSSLSMNSCAKAFGNWSRGKNFRQKKTERGVQRAPPPPASLRESCNPILLREKIIKSSAYRRVLSFSEFGKTIGSVSFVINRPWEFI